MTNYKKLEAWKKSMTLVKQVYIIVKTYPKEELFALTSQIKRAAILFLQTLLKASEEIIKRILYNFCILQEVRYMN